MRHPFRAVQFALPLLAAAPLAGQAEVAFAPAPAPATAVVPLAAAPAQRPAWTIRLTSDWPQYQTGTLCVNGGSESLNGTLTVDSTGAYHGFLERKATIQFCGKHAGAARECHLTLSSGGTVAATAHVEDGAAPVMLLAWSTPPDSGYATVQGTCQAEFLKAVRQLYLSVGHAIEVPLPAAGDTQAIRLEDYGWIAELQ